MFVKRYKRFFADIKVKNKIVTAHCPNSGSMMGLLNQNNKVWITEALNKKRKLKYTLQIIEDNGSLVGVNTHFTNKIVNDALQKNLNMFLLQVVLALLTMTLPPCQSQKLLRLNMDLIKKHI